MVNAVGFNFWLNKIKIHLDKTISTVYNVLGFETEKVNPTNKYRGIAQLVEQWSPKPRAVGSNPTAPAKDVSG